MMPANMNVLDAIARQVRAYQPWPTAFTAWNGQQMKVLGARAGEGSASPGEVIAGARNQAGVGTGEGVLWLEEVQLAGKKPTPIAAFLAGARGFVGSRLL